MTIFIYIYIHIIMIDDDYNIIMATLVICKIIIPYNPHDLTYTPHQVKLHPPPGSRGSCWNRFETHGARGIGVAGRENHGLFR